MLKIYKQKRNFDKTNEPVGEFPEKQIKSTTKKRIFVVQFHRASRDHFDFRLEWKDVLLSWAVPKGPSLCPKEKRLAVHVEDHPVDYADFEGNIPKGQYGGGSVMLWDEGFWKETEDFEKGLKKEVLKFELFGKRLKGKWSLFKVKNDEKVKGEKNWLLVKEKDEFAEADGWILERAEDLTSIRTGRTSQEIAQGEILSAKKNPFDSVSVQLATLVRKAPKGDDWLFEVKYDGYRIVAFLEDGKVKLVTRNGNNFISKFKELEKALKEFANGRAMILDGEAVVIDENGKSDFQELQNYIKKPNGKMLVFMIFDLIALDGEDLREVSLHERKEKLQVLLQNAPENLQFSEHVIGKGQECFEAADKLGLEGIVGKKKDSKYKGERNDDWVKIKCRRQQEFVIGGFTRTNKSGKGISALLLGVFEKEKFVFCGKAGTGLKESDAKELLSKFARLKKKSCPFEESSISLDSSSKSNKTVSKKLEDTLKPQKKEEIFWLKPEIVVEIEYAEFTNEKVLRQASFKGVREDKDAKNIVLENEETVDDPARIKKKIEIESDSVAISNPNKILFKDCGVKKIDVVKYYLAVADRMLPHMQKRILSVVRCHGGVGKECFFKKHPNTQSEGVVVIPIENSDGEKSNYFYVENATGLVSEVQLGTIEFHPWGSRVEDLEKPDIMVFDLDPDEKMDLSQIRQGVKDLKSVLDELSLKSFLKISGGKGYHVVVPFKPKAGWKFFHDFAETVAKLMESKWSERYTSNVRKDSRKGKIFIDWIRNGRGATSIAPYSLRSRPGAKVSMPIAWSELDKIAPNGIDMFEALKLIKKKDPWEGFFDVKQELKE